MAVLSPWRGLPPETVWPHEAQSSIVLGTIDESYEFHTKLLHRYKDFFVFIFIKKKMPPNLFEQESFSRFYLH